ncbi:QsdR family transcriptional regulator [Microbacterium aoyamense]|uniref:QsdR family transcriptional regulator n=1 Tax=Microbacterium aoyamense TaxID=344166 RepID=A0ABN2PQS7_9MICO|nr:QsdR family transcriptional regulator [Microbacterium aoyamense]
MTTATASRIPIATVGVEAASSWLSERLSSGAHPDAVRAFEAAREIFIDGRRIDMGSLAGSLGVERTSLFRWVGNRDALLSEVLWSLAIPTLVQADHAATESSGGARIAGILTHFVDDLITADYFRQFLRREPARALRLLTTKESPIQRRYVATAEWLVRRDLGDEPLGGAIDPPGLAYLLVRMSESFTYADLISGDQPSAERARVAFRLLLRVDD